MTECSVLLVEDEVIVALDVEQVAQAAGLCVRAHAVRGSEALELFETCQPALCLVDLQLLDGPVGFECGQRFALAGAMVVFMTANQSVLPADLGGAYGVITKPYTSAGLLNVMNHLRQVLSGEPSDGAVPTGLRVSDGPGTRSIEEWKLVGAGLPAAGRC